MQVQKPQNQISKVTIGDRKLEFLTWNHDRWHLLFQALLMSLLLLISIVTPAQAAQDNIYQTYGTHNPPSQDVCARSDCTYTRKIGEPTDPEFPIHWTSNWNMYRVFKQYQQFPPPYDNHPPPELQDGTDYETSRGTTYYDSEWSSSKPALKGVGAMRETYKDRCLPIFPIDNHFSCSFISLGDTAFFQTYPDDRPAGMPEYCLFSPLNHPPRRDFISHLPYSKGDSAQLKNKIQGYSFWIDPQSGKPIQTGVSPDLTNRPAVLFGYGFWSQVSLDSSDPKALAYRHPQSFYFSGYPAPPANAPIVSQNYTDFSMRQLPAETWSTVEALDPQALPACHLFEPESTDGSRQQTQSGVGDTRKHPTWARMPR